MPAENTMEEKTRAAEATTVDPLPATGDRNQHSQPKRPTEFEIISFVLTGVGLVLAVVFLGGRVGRVATELVVALWLLTIIVLCRRFLKQYLHGAIAASVIIVLGIVAFHFWRDSRTGRETPKDNKNQTGSIVPTQTDPWREWSEKVQREVKACSDDRCVAGIVSANRGYPPATSTNPVDRLNADIRAGAFLMSITPVTEMLDHVAGIKKHFLGDGFSAPEDEVYWKARVPEFLIRNYSDTNEKVWTWCLDPDTLLDKKLSDVVNSKEGLVAGARARNQELLLANLRSHLSLTDETAAVIRLQRFPEKRPDGTPFYLGTIGRPGAKRVFVMHLGAVYNSTIREAAMLSGYPKRQQRTKDDKLWIWVYFPAQGELERATWDHIISSVHGWISEP